VSAKRLGLRRLAAAFKAVPRHRTPGRGFAALAAGYHGVMCAAVALLALLPFAAIAADDLKPLSDEFYDASTLARWQRVYAVEGWGTNQLELQDINTTRTGFMVMMPFTSIWYQDYRGELTFKEVQGDFVVTTAVDASSRAGSGPPRSSFSLGGIMVPAPRAITPATWQPGGENYIFLSIGSASNPGTFQFEVKTTTNSNSVLEFQNGYDRHTSVLQFKLEVKKLNLPRQHPAAMRSNPVSLPLLGETSPQSAIPSCRGIPVLAEFVEPVHRAARPATF
jgi:hypothetical protein